MMRIKTLDQQLTNQIAAGEVVERPAAVIKELFENSVDAGATQITIEVRQGGHELIRVTDDGGGIHSQDLWLAICRHSTSKIVSIDDLASLQTLGFRGEALASIAAVSRFKLISCIANNATGFYIHTEGGAVADTIAPIAHPVGTTVEVRDLFFNTPARRQFLRSPRTEFFQIDSIIQRLALCNFHLAIKLIHNGKIIYNLPRAETHTLKEQRVEKLIGTAFMKNALAIEFLAATLHLSGWVALPTFTRSQPDIQYFYLNNRYVRDKVLTHAVRNAYQDILYHGRYPAFVLYFNCDTHSVDVNVHPTKQEVRLRDSRLIHDFIRKGVKDALSQAASAEPLTSPMTIPPPTHVQEEGAQQYDAIKQLYELPKEEILKTKLEQQEREKFTLGFAIAQLHTIYILAETEVGLIMVDMHAAHERILYEKIKRQIDEGGIQRQPLLLPINIALSPQEMRTWEQYHSLLDRLGLVSTASGLSSILIREMPCLLEGSAVDALLKDALADLQEYDSSQRIEDHINRILGNMACRSAIKANHCLTIPEMNAMLRDMENTPNSGFCNHGRPTWVQWSVQELDKFFLRGQ